MPTRRLFLTSLLAVPAVAVGVRLPVYQPAVLKSAVLFELIKRNLERSARNMSRMLEQALFRDGVGDLTGLQEIINDDTIAPSYGGLHHEYAASVQVQI